jgi:hypothetical protein
MGKKFSLYLSLFLVVLVVNMYLTLAMFYKIKRVEASNKILSEIEDNSDPQSQFDYSAAPFVTGSFETNVVVGDARSKNLKHFFRKYNSVLYDHADYIVKVSDKYEFDYRLLPAIAMQESSLCKFIPADSYNCWGWGIYGDLTTRFTSYEEAIDTVALGIKKHYIDQGLVTASSIMAKYTPSSNGSWARGVNNVLGWLE